jgi:hypothetical protein
MKKLSALQVALYLSLATTMAISVFPVDIHDPEALKGKVIGFLGLCGLVGLIYAIATLTAPFPENDGEG